MAKDAESGEQSTVSSMTRSESVHRHFYGEMKLPRTMGTIRHGYGRGKWNWIFAISFNWWSFEITAYHRWLGGFSAAYQHPRWVSGWAKYGVLTGLRIFKPYPSMPEGATIPESFRYEHWSDVVTDKELSHV